MPRYGGSLHVEKIKRSVFHIDFKEAATEFAQIGAYVLVNKDRDVRKGGKLKDLDNCYGSDDNEGKDGRDDDLRRTEIRVYNWALQPAFV